MKTETVKLWLDLVECKDEPLELRRWLGRDRTRTFRGEDEATNPIAAMAERSGGARWSR